MDIRISVADESHGVHSQVICDMINEAARLRMTGIAKRDPAYISKKMELGHAVIALSENQPVGFCYIESWEDKKFVVNSGLIVHPDYRKTGLAKAIKKEIFKLSKTNFPNARLFGITTSMAVMKINSELGYKPVTFSELTQDETFWKGCSSCSNYDILQRTNRSMCLCTGMVCDLSKVTLGDEKPQKKKAWAEFRGFMEKRRLRIRKAAQQVKELGKFMDHERK